MEQPQVNTAVSCESTRRLFDAFQHGELDVERRGRVRGHLLSCETCALAFGASVAEALQEEPFARATVLPMPKPPEPVLEAIGVWHPTRGNIWMNLYSLASQDVEWAKEEVNRVQKAIQTALLWWAATRVIMRRPYNRIPRTRGIPMEDASEPARHEYVEVEVVDSTGNPLGRTLAFEIVTPPTVTRDGRFLLSLRSDNPDSQGGMMLCTIQVDDAVLVTFTGELQSLADHRGWQVAITAEGMPTFAQQDVEIPWRQVRLSLQEIEPHAP